MIVFHSPDEVPAGFGPSVVAIGKFDGVHTGHRAVLTRAGAEAAGTGATVVAVTFDRHPLALLDPERRPEDLVSLPQKLELLAETGIDAVLVLRFDDELAALPAEEFVRRILVDALGATAVLVGEDFRFGARGAGDPALLARLGAELCFASGVVGDVRAVHDERRVSSTWIRELLRAGDVEDATRLLGHLPTVRGEVVHGLKRGRELGYPTANLGPVAPRETLEGFVPADGVYAGYLIDTPPRGTSATGGVRYPAAISVGTNPTFGDVESRQVEAYVLDETDLDLYGHVVQVQFVSRVRPMTAFDGIDALVAQMARDVEAARAVLAR